MTKILTLNIDLTSLHVIHACIANALEKTESKEEKKYLEKLNISFYRIILDHPLTNEE